MSTVCNLATRVFSLRLGGTEYGAVTYNPATHQLSAGPATFHQRVVCFGWLLDNTIRLTDN